jgi:hypothetical protein
MIFSALDAPIKVFSQVFLDAKNNGTFFLDLAYFERLSVIVAT